MIFILIVFFLCLSLSTWNVTVYIKSALFMKYVIYRLLKPFCMIAMLYLFFVVVVLLLFFHTWTTKQTTVDFINYIFNLIMIKRNACDSCFLFWVDLFSIYSFFFFIHILCVDIKYCNRIENNKSFQNIFI